MKMKATDLKNLCLLATYGVQIDLMNEEGISITLPEAEAVLESALEVLRSQMTSGGLPKRAEGVRFSFNLDDEGLITIADKKVYWKVFLFHDEHDLERREGLEDLIPRKYLDSLEIGGDTMEHCYEVKGETRREIKDRLEAAGFEYENPGGWMSEEDLDTPPAPTPQWALDLHEEGKRDYD